MGRSAAARRSIPGKISTQIPVPDPAAYLDEVRDWRVEVHYRDVTGAARVLTLPAPRTQR